MKVQPKTESAGVRTSVSHGFGEYQRAVTASFVPLAVSRVGNDRFLGRLRTIDLDAVHVSEVTASPHIVERTPHLLENSGAAFYKASLQISGTGLLVQDGRQALLEPGDLAIYDTGRPYSLAYEDDMRMLVLMFPRERLGLPPHAVDQLTAQRFSTSHGLGSMVIPFLQNMAQNFEQLGGITGSRLIGSAIDLITTMLADELDLDAAPRDGHVLLMHEIQRYVDVNLARPDLGPAQIAGAHFISTRHLHGLFQRSGTTVSTFIRERRLEKCRADLLDAASSHVSVGTVAARWGFLDAAHFSRVFKAAYGIAPSALRSCTTVDSV